MEAMAQFPDKYFELAIVDPVFGELVTQGGYMNNSSSKLAKNNNYNNSLWKQSKTNKAYFDELFRISKNQIIWGGNYFIEEIKANTSCFIVWDKENGENDFADCELAWTSFKTATRKFTFRWQGMLQGNMANKEVRIHPTQKPVALYQWLLSKFAKQGDKIIDTHVGSASSLIACHKLGFEYVGFEIDKNYFEAASKRLAAEKAQVTLMDLIPNYNEVAAYQEKLE